MRSRLMIVIFAIGALMAGLSWAQETYTPKPGSPERKALMDTVRAPVEERLHQPVIFKVNTLNVNINYAFAVLKPLQAGNQAAIDWTKTEFAEEVRAGIFSGLIVVLLKKTNADKWRIIELVWGPSDVCWETWPDEYQLPQELFASKN